ncbi:D-lactate dehydrogenase (cytochrome) [Nitrosococcus oceani ATCC 19707]|uniref:D-lactate dehydrogenase (Cytochrome) n=2 Tax=Nitrosococcus oceani TaxID=1229 RepID=Q3JE68_NITOC|nr:FAD-linked oxidase C-terminal domain-containing protein [Nitrosococcus oceani]ABA56878.1 D-lactate dehydrogenase (cytochrome) [Nitrosococcus oceani ATCC 19707]EDZ66441.1 FAD linked oxidase, C-terminal domain protein [Nitrosococcus oceani AFC27]KFI20661.1 dimethylmenaquinone methyltransferase [Nitrosococcus oceani C-27]GEM21461.1 dimethylmenaquinone methyltransferase [Nitrosococcus oceani]
MNNSAPTATPEFLAALIQIVGEQRVRSDPADCWPYGYDNSRRHALPEWVVFALTHEEVRDLVRLCNKARVPIVPRGRGTGTTGATVPISGGLVLSLERMNRIRMLDPTNRAMVVEPGVTNQEVQIAAGQQGFFWPPDPTSAAFCTLGGNLAYNSAGPRAVKYGTPRENVLALRAVTGAGEEFRCGTYTTKGVVGYDLTRLLIGSEGTLAIITEATLRLTPLPEAKRTLRAAYKDTESAGQAVADLMSQPLTPCALELMDRQAVTLVQAQGGIELPPGTGALLMIEVDGPATAMEDAVTQLKKAAHNAGLLEIVAARTPQESKQLWAARKALSPALRTLAPKKINEDVVVPVSHLPALISGLERLAKEFAITIVNFGHAGNGNLHVNLLTDPDEPTERERTKKCLEQVFKLVLSLKGSLSGEHGVGLEKRDFVAQELDPAALNLMERLKAQFDPQGILNPQKTLPLKTST